MLVQAMFHKGNAVELTKDEGVGAGHKVCHFDLIFYDFVPRRIL